MTKYILRYSIQWYDDGLWDHRTSEHSSEENARLAIQNIKILYSACKVIFMLERIEICHYEVFN